MGVLSYFVRLATFAGIIAHEMAHRWFCWLFEVRVLKVCYFNLLDASGYVTYERPQSTYQHIMICAGPILINTALGVAFGYQSSMSLLAGNHLTLREIIMLWLGISIASHAFPSALDAKAIWSGIWARQAPLLGKLIGVPIVVVIYLGALASMFWLNVVYGVMVAVYLPRLLMPYFGSFG